MAVFPGFLLQIYWWLIESKQPLICFNNSFNLLSILGVASFSLYTDPPLDLFSLTGFHILNRSKGAVHRHFTSVRVVCC